MIRGRHCSRQRSHSIVRDGALDCGLMAQFPFPCSRYRFPFPCGPKSHSHSHAGRSQSDTVSHAQPRSDYHSHVSLIDIVVELFYVFLAPERSGGYFRFGLVQDMLSEPYSVLCVETVWFQICSFVSGEFCVSLQLIHEVKIR